MQTSFRGLFSKYFDTLVKQIEVENQRLRDLEQAHHRLLSSRGEVPQEKLDKYEEHVATFTKLHANLQGIADSLNRDMPVLKPKAEVEDVRETIEILTVDFGIPKSQLQNYAVLSSSSVSVPDYFLLFQVIEPVWHQCGTTKTTVTSTRTFPTSKPPCPAWLTKAA